MGTILIVIIPSNNITSISGRSIKSLMEITKASIHVSDSEVLYPNTEDRVVYITGNESQVSLAQSLVWEMIGQQSTSLLKDEKFSPTWDPIAARDSPGDYDR